MTFYIEALIVDESVAHLYCSDAQIDCDVLQLDKPHVKVKAEVNGDYQDAAIVFPLLGWDGEALTGLDFVSQVIERPTKP